MASSLLRFATNRCILASKSLQPSKFVPLASISTSKKNKDVAVSTEPGAVKEPWQKEVEDEVARTTKNWVAYGYDIHNRDEDEWWHMSHMFWAVTMCMVAGSFILAYMPDYRMRDWTHREAFLELARRERDGLPLVDPDYVPKDQIELPSDEELGDFDIVL